MTDITERELVALLDRLVKLPQENECVEFKKNFHSNEEIGELISALSNGACLHNQDYAYLVFGVEDESHNIIGTTFKAKSYQKGKECLEHWLMQMLTPHIDFRIYEFDYQNNHVSLFKIPAARDQPVKFTKVAYIRIGSTTRKLADFPDKERKIWSKKSVKAFEKEIALQYLQENDILQLLDTKCYFELLKIPYPTSFFAVLDRFEKEKLIMQHEGVYSITNLGALLFAKDINEFENLTNKAIRVVVYKGKNRLETIKDIIGVKGYACGFAGLIKYINDQLPQNEEIKKALRETVKMYPEIAIRELVANAIIHQDFNEKGRPVVEIFTDRIEITNPGLPIISIIRFIDEYQSRNELLANLMRRLRVCEGQGSGIDKVISNVELYQLPAPEFIEKEKNTKTILYAYQKFNDMGRTDKIRACYQHSCLKSVSHEKMTNQSLRERFQIEAHNYSIVSRIIKDTIDEGLIKDDDPDNKSRKYAKYIPFWG